MILPDRDPLTGVPPSRHPFQFWVLLACALNGAVVAFHVGPPRTLEDLLPTYAVTTWGWMLMLCGLIGLAAIWWRDRITGLLMERIALGGIAGITAVYSTAIVLVAGAPGYVSATFLFSISLAGVWRIVHINRELKVLTRWIERNF